MKSREEESKQTKRRKSLEVRFKKFLLALPNTPTIMSVTPKDICRFLVWNDKFGKTQIHGMSCPHIGEFGIHRCGCAIRLAAGTVHGMVQSLSEISSGVPISTIYTWKPQTKLIQIFITNSVHFSVHHIMTKVKFLRYILSLISNAVIFIGILNM